MWNANSALSHEKRHAGRNFSNYDLFKSFEAGQVRLSPGMQGTPIIVLDL